MDINTQVFNGIYRGFVTWNDDPAVKGRIKIFVPGVYSDIYSDKPEMLPWASPAMSSFGGNSINPNADIDKLLNKETGWASAPHMGNVETGAQVWVFFERGDINFPVYFAFAQSGDGWLSEHPNQHVFKSDNVRIRIDENVKDERSTCKFDSYNSKNSKISKANLERDCKKHSWKFDRENGNIKQLETRIDIEVLAENLNAINLNIHGNINMRIDGNWFVEHIGNKYEYHKGDTYVKQIGSTYIEQDGNVRTKLTGDETRHHIGNNYVTHDGDTLETHTGTHFTTVDGDVTMVYNSECKLTVGKNYSEIIKMSKSSDVIKSSSLNIGTDYKQIIGNDKFVSCEGAYDCLVGESIKTISYRGNITLETKGDFELMKEGKITQKGFNNIGTKGNIQVISTFGNINLQCKKDESKALFNKKSVVIPWNPGFVAEMEKVAALYPAFNKHQAILGAEEFPTNISDIGSFTSLFNSLSTLFIYDGLPVFLPTRMIVQNPNIPIPSSTDDLSWIPNFRSEAKDWRSITSSEYWKLPGRMMGNINIETWSGDINIKTKSELGCAGNINIEATESAGTLPGYKIGSINMVNNGRKRIYPDPRDLFLDSNFNSRNAGKLELFTHGTNLTDSFRRSVLPTAADSILQSTTGFSFNWKATNYDKFYDMYGINVISRGNFGAMSKLALTRLNDLKKRPAPVLGCIKCISDYLLGMPGVQDICYASEDFSKFSCEENGLHIYGFSKYNPFDTKNPRGTFNILAGDFDKISIGDGHAIEKGFIDKEYVGKNIGYFSINSSGSFNQTIGRNYNFKCNTDYKDGKKSISYTYTEKWYDDVWPLSFKAAYGALTSLAVPGFSYIGTLSKGNFNINKIPKVGDVKTSFNYLDPVLPSSAFMIIGYHVKDENITGSKSKKLYEEGFESSINLGFDITNIKKVLMNPTGELAKRRLEFSDYVFVNEVSNNSIIVESKSEFINRQIKMNLDQVAHSETNVTKTYNYSFDKINNLSVDYRKSGDNYDLRNVHTLSGINEFNSIAEKSFPIPKVYLKTKDNLNKIIGHGFKNNSEYISYLQYDTDPAVPTSTYIDYIENFEKTVVDDLPEKPGDPRNIIINDETNSGWNVSSTILFDCDRSISEDITWTSPINKKTLNLISNGVFIDEDAGKEIGINNIKVNLLGNEITSGKVIEKYNAIAYEAKDFPINNIFVNNGRLTDESSNKIEVNNGITTKKSTNEIYINNGKGVEESTNNIKFENGTDATGTNTNRYVIKNGFGGPNSNCVYDVYNGDGQTSMKMEAIVGKPDASKITEFTSWSKLINIGNDEVKNIGQTQTTTIGSSKIINVPQYTFNTMTMTMNNVTSTTINTATYALNCNTDTVICKETSSLTAGKTITQTAVTAYGINSGGTFTVLTAGVGTIGAGGAITVASVGPATFGAAKKDVTTTITGKFTASGTLTGNSTTSACHHAPCTPGPGFDGTNPSAPSIPAIAIAAIQNPPAPQVPSTPYLFTNILQLYVDYLAEEFKYIINVFKRFLKK